MNGQETFKSIPFKFHPRVFRALGADLVTSDVVAIIELVKNSYDAFAENVWIRIPEGAASGSIEIQDDGKGMTSEVIEDVWCMVATPYKEKHSSARRDNKVRRVAGEKGLGRLSAARLGDNFQMITKASGSPCYEVTLDWSALSDSETLKTSVAKVREYPGTPPFKGTGTLIRIRDLRAPWDNNQVLDLEDNLARLKSPFQKLDDFNIYVSRGSTDDPKQVKIESPEFLSKPKYLIAGSVDSKGTIKAKYTFTPMKTGKARTADLKMTWEQIYDSIQDKGRFPFSSKSSNFGPIEFELRAWDIASDDTQEIADHFQFKRAQVRHQIKAHKGISVYRDNILVLPKSDTARDWLGLDLRRISKVGTRMGTSQIVGYVAISKEENPKIEDTSDRERLASCLAVAEFEECLKATVSLLETERDEDKIKRKDEPKPMDSLFEKVSAEDLLAEVIALADENKKAADAVPVLMAFNKELDKAREAIQERFVYYSRLATVGTIAQMLVHEIRNRTTAFGYFLQFVQDRLGPFKDKELEKHHRNANKSVEALEHLADNFSPLASRSFRRKVRDAVLERQIQECLELQQGELKRKNIECVHPDTETRVAVDPAELDAVILNLLSNAIYWLGEVAENKRKIEIRLGSINDGKRVRVWVHDTGPGLRDGDAEKILLPGVTRKPGGIGMGLTVASELIAEYEGTMIARTQGVLGGASFGFDIPRKND